MAERINAECSICGKGYHMCLACKDKMALSPWKLHTDTSEHYKIYQILRGVTIGVYSNEEAKAKLQTVDLSDIDSFKDNIKSRINDIIKEDVVEPISENIVDTVNIKISRKRKQREKSCQGTE